MSLLKGLVIYIGGWDRTVQILVLANHRPALIAFFTWITAWGNSSTLILLCALATFWLILERRWRSALILDAGMTAAWVVMASLKLLVGRIRPLGEHLVYAGGYSFPSGHAMFSMVFYGFLGYWISLDFSGWKRLAVRIAAGLMALLIGFSRIYLNVHYASDVIMGFIIGGLFLLLMIRVHKWAENSRQV